MSIQPIELPEMQPFADRLKQAQDVLCLVRKKGTQQQIKNAELIVLDLGKILKIAGYVNEGIGLLPKL
jgi:hypothetical protein